MAGDHNTLSNKPLADQVLSTKVADLDKRLASGCSIEAALQVHIARSAIT